MFIGIDPYHISGFDVNATGAMQKLQTQWGNYDSVVKNTGIAHSVWDIRSSRVVSTGAENSPRTLSILYWRRVA